MSKTKTIRKLLAYCEKIEQPAVVQKLTFGYERVFMDFMDNREGFYEMCKWLDKHKSLWYQTGCPYSPLHEFNGHIFVMPVKERDEWMTLCKQDQERLDDWWRRYHAADEETRRLMACGAIA